MDGINNLQIILTQAIQDMKEEQGKHFDIEHINLAELERRTGISRSRLRSLKKNGFRFLPKTLKFVWKSLEMQVTAEV